MSGSMSGAMTNPAMNSGFGTALPNVSNQNPTTQGALAQFQNMTPEQLQETALKYGPNSQLGQLAGRVLQQKRMAPQTSMQQQQQQVAQQNQAPQQQQQQAPAQSGIAPQVSGGMGSGFARGGMPHIVHFKAPPKVAAPHMPSIHPPRRPIGFGGGGQPPHMASFGGGGPAAMGPPSIGGGMPHFDAGGMPMSADSPWWERSESREAGEAPRGFLNSSIGGRTDHIAASPASNSYVIPADVVSGLGEGNSLAGARFLETAMATGPHGTALPRGRAGGSYGHIPAPPRPPANQSTASPGAGFGMPQAYKDGGHTDPRGGVKAMLAGGEYVLSPEQVAAIGGGDVARGQRILDKFVVAARKRIIDQMKKLPGPVKS